MSSSGMWRCVGLVLTDVSEERIASIVRGAKLMEGLRSYETSANTRPSQRNIPKDDILHSHRCESLKSYKVN
jgi:hypothetical protein